MDPQEFKIPLRTLRVSRRNWCPHARFLFQSVPSKRGRQDGRAQLIEEGAELSADFVWSRRRLSLIYCAQLRIGGFNLNHRRDFDLRLTLVELDGAGNPDDFPLEYRDPLVGRDS